MVKSRLQWRRYLVGAALGILGCGDSGMTDMAAIPDASGQRDLAVYPDSGQPPPDLATTADLSTLPDYATPPDLAAADFTMLPNVLLKRESQSSAIAISDDDKVVAAVSPDDDLLYLINTTTNNSKVAVQLAKGCEPRSVAYAPDYSFWVACRGNNTAVNIQGIDQMAPTLGAPVAVGSEPTAIIVGPAGGGFATANYADGTVSLYDAMSKIVIPITVGGNPRALAITNSGLGDDTKETLFVTLMFAQAIGGGVASEGNDVGRQGIVVPITFVQGPKVGAPIALAPIADTTFKVPNKANPPVNIPVGAYPNQLQGVALHNGKGYVVATAASPSGPVNFAGNVHPFVSVFDAATKMEKPFGSSGANANTLCGTNVAMGTKGYAAGTLDLAIQVRDATSVNTPILFPTNPIAIAFVPAKNLDVGYVVSMASDEVLRVSWDYPGNTACTGSNMNKVINLQAMAGDIKAPIGMVIRNDGALGYVNSWVGREVETIDFAAQAVKDRIALSPQPNAEPGLTTQKGKKFFWTSTGRWSKAGWGSCGSCHPDGLSDGVTFVFVTGPRQTLPLDSTYAKKMDGTPDATDQRILNWSAIFDEIHDFENNTRGVSGGKGAIVTVNDNPIDLIAAKAFNLVGSVKQLAADNTNSYAATDGNGMAVTEKVGNATAGAWDAIDAYVQTFRSQKHPATIDPASASVMAGAAQFTNGGCAKCHGGPKWTISRRPYTPTLGAAMGSATCSLQTSALGKKSVPSNGNKPQNTDLFQLQTERPGAKACVVTADCGGTPGVTCVNLFCTVVPPRLTCSLRNVGTFGAGPQTAAFEVRSDTDANGKSLIAEGAAGLNPPSLLSLSVTAPYLHNGAAQTLADLFTNAAYRDHLTAGNANFAPDMTGVTNLVNYLLSIDPSTTPPAIDPNFDLCTGSFAANQSVCTNP